MATVESCPTDLKTPTDTYNCLSSSVIQGQAGLEDFVWYVLRDLTRPNTRLSGYRLLLQENIEVFTPLKWVTRITAHRKERLQVPVIHDLLFAFADRQVLDPIIDRTDTLQYRYVRGGAYRQPMTVGHTDMARFIQAVNATDTPRFYTPAELDELSYGKQIRLICDGPLNGYVGRLLSIRGGRKKRLVITLPGLLAVEYEVSPDFIQFL